MQENSLHSLLSTLFIHYILFSHLMQNMKAEWSEKMRTWKEECEQELSVLSEEERKEFLEQRKLMVQERRRAVQARQLRGVC